MPVAYTPQFIPTNAQALQGVLSEYQQAYDQNLARELEIQDQYSMIPTISAEDTQRKNDILGKFSESMKDIEKKYNYDRASSAYSKELARKIGELRKNDFWSYNERKKELVKAAEEDKRRLGAGYYSVYDPTKATYENQSALDNYRPFNKRELIDMGRAIGEEYSKANPSRGATPILDPRTGEPIGIEYRNTTGFTRSSDMDAFIAGDKGNSMINQALLAAGIPEELLSDPELRSAAIGGMRSGLIGTTDYDRISLPTLKEGSDSKNKTPFVKVGTEAGDKIETPIPVNNARDYVNLKRNPEAATTPEGQQTLQYMDTIVSGIENSNIDIINRGKDVLRGILDNTIQGRYTEEELNTLFNDLKDKYLASSMMEAPITGDVIRTTLGELAPQGRIDVLNNFLKSKGGTGDNPNVWYNRNSINIAKDAIEGMDSWYRGSYKDVANQINSQIKEGYRPVWDVLIPGTISQSDKNLMKDFAINTVAVGAGSPVTAKYQSGKGKQGESSLYDDKALAQFNAIEGPSYVGLLKSEGKLPRIRLTKGEEKLDFTFKPEISSFGVWQELASQAEDPAMFMDAFYSGYDMLENADYKLDKNSEVYIKDMSKLFKDKGVSEKDIADGLKNYSWKKEVDEWGSSHYTILHNGQKVPDKSGNPIEVGTKQELFAALTSIVIK